GYEIKSDADTLDRLATQSLIYSSVLDRVTLVVGRRHIDEATGVVPEWWGIRMFTAGSRGAIAFPTIRPSRRNPGIDPVALAALLWRDEVVEILCQYGESGALLREPRSILYSHLAASVSLDDLRGLVRLRLKAREGWRDPKQPSPN